MDRYTQQPKARTEKLIIKDLSDETLVYDLESDKAHCLNSTAALVWKNCDGRATVADIAQLLGDQTPTADNEGVVWLALDQLEKFQLLQSPVVKPANVAALNRRDWVRKVGFAALALPAIISIAAPAAHAQASCVNPGGRAPGVGCGSPNQCCTNVCCTPTTAPGCANNTCL
ncbi:MAG TPA: PqqD family protein [Pyrinomonadaceae bacterium]|nr:PqqD family protein [Pyrinomonadaceae bacterium]